MIRIEQKGHFDNTIRFLHFLYNRDFLDKLDSFGERGVNALAAETPIDSGKTASSWYYEVETTPRKVVIRWCNSNVNEGIPIAILIQYGHATANGYYVQGNDFINPAIRPVFDDIAQEIWREVTNA